MNSAQAIQSFWESFDWAAYDSSTVPSEEMAPEMPRITYDVAKAEFEAPITLSASLWDRGYSWERISRKEEEIFNYIGLGGVLVPYDYGKLWIKRGTPFAQRMADEDDAIRRVYLNIEVEYFTNK